jgi:hypothetical protein
MGDVRAAAIASKAFALLRPRGNRGGIHALYEN